VTSTLATTVTPPASPSLLHLIMPTEDEIARARRRIQAKAVVIVVLALASYWGLVIASTGFAVRLACALGLIAATVAIATNIMHDANHAALASSARLNRVFSWSADLLGASSWLWRFKHNRLHHANPNVVDVDSDISQAPFAQLAPAQRWRP
jgi:linoleoyl-CoA desaturase